MENPIVKALGGNKYTQVVNLLFNARTNTHILHLQSRSYAQHVALNEFYSGILDIADSFAEASMGVTGSILTGFDLGKLNTQEPSAYLKSQLQELLSLRNQFKEGDLVQLIDDASELFHSTIYKLTFLK
mgnify:FL=1